jgi:hypothetical protein
MPQYSLFLPSRVAPRGVTHDFLFHVLSVKAGEQISHHPQREEAFPKIEGKAVLPENQMNIEDYCRLSLQELTALEPNDWQKSCSWSSQLMIYGEVEPMNCLYGSRRFCSSRGRAAGPSHN